MLSEVYGCRCYGASADGSHNLYGLKRWGRGEKKDTAQKDKPIEITDVTGQMGTLKEPAERVLLQWSGSSGAFSLSIWQRRIIPRSLWMLIRRVHSRNSTKKIFSSPMVERGSCI